MGSKRYSKELKMRARELRLSGKSYSQIMKTLSLRSKGTVSSWLNGLTLTARAKNLLEKNNDRAYKSGLFAANNIRRKRIESENQESFTEGRNRIHSTNDHDLLLIGTALYWGEGTKSYAGKRSSPSLTFTNSDPLMVSVFMRFLREIMGIEDIKIRAGIHIYPSIKEKVARKFWSDITGLPLDRFYIVNQISRSSSGKRRTLSNGTVVIRFNNRRCFHYMLGLISGLANNLSLP